MNPLVILALALIGVGLAGGAAAASSTRHLNLPDRAKPYLGLLETYGRLQQIPPRILAAWIARESDWNPGEYNPEKGAMERWACEIGGAPERWGNNPDFSHAVAVCARLGAGEPPEAVAPLWTFGSIGLLQVSRISASESGGLPYSANNNVLYDPETNILVGARTIAAERSRLYPGRSRLTDAEWSWVRAAYVGGHGILTQRPDKAREIALAYLKTLQSIG